ncbi:hypothetical protein [Gottfriedia solisilvae]|uniref:hypothetical protein n=1 Tax=Gottfriedia solisilvae TaxID=1516104 RepID=UPI003D2EFF0B
MRTLAANKEREWQKINSKRIGEIKSKINRLDINRTRGNISEIECFDNKPTCLYEDKIHKIVGYSYNVGDHNYLKFTLREVNKTDYFTIYAWNVELENVRI